MRRKPGITAFALSIMMLVSGCGSADMENTSALETAEGISQIETETADVPEETESAAWRTTYADYIDGLWKDGQPDSAFSFSLIYLDNDDIPELFISTACEADGEIAVTYYDGKISEESLPRMGSMYIERSGLIYTNTGHMGYYPVYIRKLEKGEFSVIGSGIRTERLDNENDNLIKDYEWEGKMVSEEEYNDHIDLMFDREQGICPERRYSSEEMLSLLKTGKCTSAGHRYELIEDDVTWEEAQTLCHEKGGYLATITSPDEQDAVAALIAKEEKQDISFYVGYRSSEWIGEEFYGSRWINKDGSLTDAFNLYNFRKYSSPDYEPGQYKWDRDHTDCGLVKYYNREEQIYLFEAPENLPDVSPEYSGKMGYICEFDE